MRDFSKAKTLLDIIYIIDAGKTVAQKKRTILFINASKRICRNAYPNVKSVAISRDLYSLDAAIVNLAAYDMKIESPAACVTEDDMDEIYFITLSGRIPEWCILAGKDVIRKEG